MGKINTSQSFILYFTNFEYSAVDITAKIIFLFLVFLFKSKLDIYALNLFLSFVLTAVLWNSNIKIMSFTLAIKSGLCKEGFIVICSSVNISIFESSSIFRFKSVKIILMNSFKYSFEMNLNVLSWPWLILSPLI